MKIKLTRSEASEIPKGTKQLNQNKLIYLFIYLIDDSIYIPFLSRL